MCLNFRYKNWFINLFLSINGLKDYGFRNAKISSLSGLTLLSKEAIS
jgi:hypothetical protein